MKNYTEITAAAVDKWVEAGWVWGRPVTAEECDKARRGEWGVFLTPTKHVPKDWFLPFNGAKILGLASGGGQQMPVFSLLGAECTVMDLSDRQLESEKSVAAREGYEIEIVKADMTQPFPFADGAFDMIFHPVSNCYIEDVLHVWRECFRVLRPGGVLLAGMSNEVNYLFENDEPGKPLVVENILPYNPLKNPAQMAKLQAEWEDDDCVEFSHSFEEQIGGQLKAGFVIAGAYDDINGDGRAADLANIPAFWATKAVKPHVNQEGL